MHIEVYERQGKFSKAQEVAKEYYTKAIPSYFCGRSSRKCATCCAATLCAFNQAASTSACEGRPDTYLCTLL